LAGIAFAKASARAAMDFSDGSVGWAEDAGIEDRSNFWKKHMKRATAWAAVDSSY
jgi:hypothetical protein